MTSRPSDVRACQSRRSRASVGWKVAFVGDESLAEWQQLLSQLRGCCEVSVTPYAEPLVSDSACDLILLAPSFPGDQSYEAALSVVARCPLTPVWLVVGSWLEGETRTGRAWPGIPRYYRDQVVPEILSQWAVCENTTPVAVPATETPDELAFRDARKPLPKREGVAVVWAAAPTERNYLRQLCGLLGFEAVAWHESPRVPSAQLVVYDAVARFEHATADVQSLRQQYPQARLLVLSSFPRSGEVAAWQAAGADVVLGKPFRLPHFAAVTG